MSDGAILLTARKGFRRPRSWVIDTQPLTIGRSNTCDIVIPDPTVSRQHCEIMRQDGTLVVKDLKSSNLLMINGLVVNKGTLQVGDELGIGSALFLVTSTNPDPLTTPVSMLDETATLAEGDITLLRQPLKGAPLPASPAEYAFLFHFGHSLSQCLTEDDLIARGVSQIRKHFAANVLWLLRWTPDGFMPAGPSAQVDDRLPPQAELEKFASKRQSVLLPRFVDADTGKHLATLLIAPLHVARAPWGLLAVWAAAPQRTYEDTDLHLFAATAGVLAPHLRAIEETERLRRQKEELLALSQTPSGIVGRSPAIHRLREAVHNAAVTDLPVLILGETGSGKELVATAIHEQSRRADKPFVVVNCAAIPNELFESEFFGHVKGAFTGAAGSRVGLAESADTGTLFLDEIGDLSPENQARLLRFIELGTFRRLGDTEERQVDVRTVAATNRDLWKPGFRSDLLYRLDGFTIEVPPLRCRVEDIPLLAQHFLGLIPANERGGVNGFSDEALDFMCSLPWAGNVREFMKAVRRSVNVSRGPLVTLDDVVSCIRPSDESLLPPGQQRTLAEVERTHVEQVIRACDGNLTQAAKILGVSRTTLYNKRQTWKGEGDEVDPELVED